MSIKISSLVWQHYPAGGSELLTALAYADHAHDDGTSIRPSVKYIAKKTRQSERTVQRYLSSMRRSGWLEIVRFARGGRGFATEYRINPLWISNPGILPPIHITTCTSATSPAHKGDNECSERVYQVTPQPPRNINEPPAQRETPPSSLSWPEALQTHATTRIMQRCPVELRQLVLDEIAALQSHGKIRSAVGLLRKLVERAEAGSFSPTAAYKKSAGFDQQASQKKQTAHSHELKMQSCDKAIGRKHMSDLKRKFRLP